TNVGATETTGFGIPTNCTPPWSGGQRDVWFTFTTTATLIDISICINGITMLQPQVALYRGDCTGLFEVICLQAPIGEADLQLDVLALDPSIPYFIRVNDYSATGTPNSGTFDLCVKEFIPPAVIDDVTVTTCTGSIFDTGDAGGEYSNNENINFSICPTDPHDCIVLDIVSYDIENGFDNLFIHNGPDNSTPPIFAVTGVGTNLNIPVSTTGCVTLNFVSDGSVTADGFELNWQCTSGGCPTPPADIVACTGSFFDSGGAAGDYSNNENDQTIICPDDPTQCVTLGFTQFEIENFFDNLTILDGAGQFSPPIGSFTGTNSPGTVTATNDGCLTVIFTSDGSVTDPGWSANIVCNTCGLAPPCTGVDPMCAGIPDDCSLACDLGAQAAPGLCPGAAPIVQTYCISNVGATPSSPYSSQTGCAGGGDQANPAADIWYTFVASANEMNITLQSNLTAANLALYQGDQCGALFNVACAISNDGTVTLNSTAIVIGQTYYIQISGADAMDQADDMTLELESIKDCTLCFNAGLPEITPDPGAGFSPGQTVQFCYTVTEWNQSSANWIHAAVPIFGSAWDASTLMPVSSPPSCDGQGTWAWYTSFTSTNTNITYGPGFAYDSPLGGPFDGDPGNNFGDNCQGLVDFEFCWSIQVASPLPPGPIDASMAIDVLGDSESGSWGSNDCQGDINPSFNLPPINNCNQPQVAVTSVNADCGAGTLGSIDLTPTGTGPFTYVWNDPMIGDVSSAANLPAGTYTIEVTDNGEACPTLVSVDILEVGTLAPATNLISNVLCGSGVGSAEVVNTNGTGPYTYFWSNGETTQIATGLSVGTNTVNVVDANGCVGFSSIDIGFDTQPLALSVSPSTSICAGDNTVLSVSGAASYSWSPTTGLSSPNSSTPTASPTTTTTYTVTGSVIGPNLVQNGNFEQGNTGFTSDYGPPQGGAFGPLSVPGTYDIDTDPANTHINFASCQDNSTVGIGQMLIANGSQNAGDNIWCQTVDVVPGNDYIYSAFGASVVPGTPAILELTIDGASVSTLALSSTTCDWTFFGANVNSGASTQVQLCITNLETADGGNDFAIDDIEFRPVCQGTETVTVEVSDIETSLVNTTDEICGGDGMGSAEVQATGGIVGADYTYLWDDPGAQTDALATGLLAGTYTVTVTDDIGCIDVLSVDILGPPPVTGVTSLLAPSTCEGQNPGQAFVTPNPGNSPFTFLWSNGETNFQAFNLTPGINTVTIIDANGCSGVETIDVPTTPLPLIDNVTGTRATCGEANGSIEVQGTIQNGPALYSVDGGLTTQADGLFQNLPAGAYEVVIIDDLGCQASQTFILD
ncbi:MAG: CUB domain-containing protein, partial [Bacteroidota bacterium]